MNRASPLPTETAPAPAARLRVMTYNVHGCVGVDRKLDVGRIAAVIARERPDVVALQELDVGRVRSGRVDQAQVLAERLGMAFHFNAALRVAAEAYGDAILSTLPLHLAHSGALPRPARAAALETRGALWVELDLPGGERLQVINTHLGLLPFEQRGQVEALLGPEWMGAAARRGPALLVGDFNATPRYAAYHRLTTSLRDLRAGSPDRGAATFPSRLPVLRIDHLFATPGVSTRHAWVADGVLARRASDHRPLVADLEVDVSAAARAANLVTVTKP